MSQDKTLARIAALPRQAIGTDNEHDGQTVRANDSYIKSGAWRADITGRYVVARDERGSCRRRTVAPTLATSARIRFQQGFAQNIKTRPQGARRSPLPEAIGEQAIVGSPRAAFAQDGVAL